MGMEAALDDDAVTKRMAAPTAVLVVAIKDSVVLLEKRMFV